MEQITHSVPRTGPCPLWHKSHQTPATDACLLLRYVHVCVGQIVIYITPVALVAKAIEPTCAAALCIGESAASCAHAIPCEVLVRSCLTSGARQTRLSCVSEIAYALHELSAAQCRNAARGAGCAGRRSAVVFILANLTLCAEAAIGSRESSVALTCFPEHTPCRHSIRVGQTELAQFRSNVLFVRSCSTTLAWSMHVEP